MRFFANPVRNIPNIFNSVSQIRLQYYFFSLLALTQFAAAKTQTLAQGFEDIQGTDDQNYFVFAYYASAYSENIVELLLDRCPINETTRDLPVCWAVQHKFYDCAEVPTAAVAPVLCAADSIRQEIIECTEETLAKYCIHPKFLESLSPASVFLYAFLTILTVFSVVGLTACVVRALRERNSTPETVPLLTPAP